MTATGDFSFRPYDIGRGYPATNQLCLDQLISQKNFCSPTDGEYSKTYECSTSSIDPQQPCPDNFPDNVCKLKYNSEYSSIPGLYVNGPCPFSPQCNNDTTTWGSFVCHHESFAASPSSVLSCCFQDANNNPSEHNKSVPEGTCSFTHRNLASDQQPMTNPDTAAFLPPASTLTCRAVVTDYCQSGSPSVLYSKWSGQDSTKDCRHAFDRIVTGKNNSWNTEPLFYTPEPQATNGVITNQLYGKQTAAALYNSLVTARVDLSATPSQPGYHPMSDVLYTLCKDTPWACRGFLQGTATVDGYCSNESTTSLKDNPGKLKWCGCNMPPVQYDKYTKSYGVSIPCSPSCNRGSVIDYIENEFSTTPAQCKSSICVIDNLNISYTDIAGSGNISLSQVCGSCATTGASGGCDCIVENDKTVETGYIDDLQVNQVCGRADYYDVSTDASGAVNYTRTGGNLPSGGSGGTTNYLFVLLAVVLVIVLLGFLGNYFSS